jgi:hypothetical protein
MPFEERKCRKSRKACSLRSHTPVTLPLIIFLLPEVQKLPVQRTGVF